MNNLNRIAKFEKVSYEQYKKDYNHNIDVETIYNDLQLPKRATKYSAGYDFYLPYDINLKPGETALIPSGIRVKIDYNWVLKCYPRSSLGFKYRLQLDNTVGIIDADYYNSLNEGHIFVKFTNHSNQEVCLTKGSAFMQGIFIQYGITIDDDATEERIGGIGSTNKK